MSVEIHVFLYDERLPSREQWQKALDEAAADLILHPQFNPREDDGFVPVRFEDEDTGFEYYYEKAEWDDLPAPVGDRDHLVTLVVHGDMTELRAAMWAAAALTRLTGGVFYDSIGDECAEGDAVFDLIERDEAA